MCPERIKIDVVDWRRDFAEMLATGAIATIKLRRARNAIVEIAARGQRTGVTLCRRMHPLIAAMIGADHDFIAGRWLAALLPIRHAVNRVGPIDHRRYFLVGRSGIALRQCEAWPSQRREQRKSEKLPEQPHFRSRPCPEVQERERRLIRDE